MKILILCNSMGIGGTERLSVAIASEFLRRKNKCAIFVIRSRNIESLAFLNKNVKVFLGKRKHKLDFVYLIELKKLIRKLKPDVILCETNFSYFSVKLASLFVSKFPIFLVLHYTHHYSLKSDIFSRFFFFILKKSSDNIIATYRLQIELFARRHNIQKRKFNLIHNGIDTSYYNKNNFTINKNSLNDIYKKAKFHIIHIANYRTEKDQWTLLKALVLFNLKYKNWKLTFRGNIPENIKKSFDRYIKEHKLSNKITFVNFLKDIRTLLRHADVFVLTSISEALPMSALEAMAMNVPCILTNVGGCSDIVDNEVNGFLIPPKNPKALTDKLLFLVENSTKLRKMSINARKKVVKDFNLEMVANKYLGLFTSSV